MAQAQALFPNSPGTQWTMKSIYTPAPVTFSVKKVQALGPRTVVELHQAYPWASYSLLVSDSPAGTMLEGFAFNGGTYWFPAPERFLRTDLAVGQSWATPIGPVTLKASNISVTIGSWNYSGVSVYAIGAEQWTVKPGFGILRYSVAGIDFDLQAAPTFSTFLAPSFVGRSCPAAGLTSIPESTTLTSHERESALQLATNIGSKNLVIGAAWSELEPALGVYRLDRLRDEFQLAARFNLPTVFNLRLPQSTQLATPSYLNGLTMDSPILEARLAALLQQIAAMMPPQVQWVNIGYEVDTYGFYNQSQIPRFLSMFRSAKTTLKAVKPGVSVGQVFSFDTSRSNDTMFQQLAQDADHIAFTYYGVYGDFLGRSADSPLFDIPLMMSMAGSKPLLLTELGYSSGVSTQAAQAAFLNNATAALKKAGGKVLLYSIWSYRDIPASLAGSVGESFGQYSPNFVNFITTSGMLDSNGAPKLAYSEVLSALPQFGAAGCSGPLN